MVPVIQDGDFTLWESNSIIRYLANQYGDGALCRPRRACAPGGQWMDWQATDLNRSWSYAFMAWRASRPPIRIPPRSRPRNRPGRSSWASWNSAGKPPAAM